MSQCSLAAHPPSGLSDDRLIEATRHLVDALVDTPEYVAYVDAAQALNLDEHASGLAQLISTQRHSFAQSVLPELQAELDGLPAMENFLAAKEALIALFTRVSDVINTSAGFDFKGHVRTREHG